MIEGVPQASGTEVESRISWLVFETMGEAALLIEDKGLCAELELRLVLRRSARVGRGV